MNFKILASESMGVRSFCTFVETEDVKIIIDPGVSLGPQRFNLPPHKIEIKALWDSWEKINAYLKESNIVIITHYHYDHHHYRNAELYTGKFLILKDYNHLNLRQRVRAEKFLSKLVRPKEVTLGDGKQFVFGKTKIIFTGPLSHGHKSDLVKVLGVLIEEQDDSLFFTSDICGEIEDNLFDFLKQRKISNLIYDGFPTYLLGGLKKKSSLLFSNEKLNKLISKCEVKRLIIDHHAARDLNWKEYYQQVLDNPYLEFCGTAAEYGGLVPLYLEANRKNLFREQ